uniref:GDNF/GAS1 domain-containing protein n=1 Tax=Anopheles merus TaxID=30066 RepID=A0A182VAH1_ANOME
MFEDFKLHCKVRENKCRMEDRDLCYEAWTNLRLSPMFGCICPNNHMKRRCDKIFSVVNHNPCVVVFFFNYLYYHCYCYLLVSIGSRIAAMAHHASCTVATRVW